MTELNSLKAASRESIAEAQIAIGGKFVYTSNLRRLAPKNLTADDAEKYSCTLTYLYSEMKKGNLRTVKIGRHRYVSPQDETEWIARRYELSDKSEKVPRRQRRQRNADLSHLEPEFRELVIN